MKIDRVFIGLHCIMIFRHNLCTRPANDRRRYILQCNVVYHWLGAYTKWSLDFVYNSDLCNANKINFLNALASEPIWRHKYWSASIQGLVAAWWHQAITWTDAGLLFNGSWGTHLSEISMIYIDFQASMCLNKSLEIKYYYSFSGTYRGTSQACCFVQVGSVLCSPVITRSVIWTKH